MTLFLSLRSHGFVTRCFVLAFDLFDVVMLMELILYFFVLYLLISTTSPNAT